MKRKNYEKATMKVVKVETETHLLSGSADADYSRAAYSGSSATWE